MNLQQHSAGNWCGTHTYSLWSLSASPRHHSLTLLCSPRNAGVGSSQPIPSATWFILTGPVQKLLYEMEMQKGVKGSSSSSSSGRQRGFASHKLWCGRWGLPLILVVSCGLQGSFSIHCSPSLYLCAKLQSGPKNQGHSQTVA